MEKENEKLKTAAELNRRRLAETQERLDFALADLEKIRRENEGLRISKGKFSAEKALEVEEAVRV